MNESAHEAKTLRPEPKTLGIAETFVHDHVSGLDRACQSHAEMVGTVIYTREQMLSCSCVKANFGQSTLFSEYTQSQDAGQAPLHLLRSQGRAPAL